MRRAVRGAVVASLVASVVWLGSPAAAHAVLVSSTPIDGGQVAEGPERIVLVFSERPDPKLSVIAMVDERGKSVRLNEPTIDSERISVDLGELERGVYAVSWRVLSTVDGHVTAGVFAFGVQVPVGDFTPTAVVGPSPTLIELAGRWLFLAGLVLAGGAALVTVLVLREITPGHGRLLTVGLFAATLGALAVFSAQWQASQGALGDFASSSIGRFGLGRIAAVLAACGWAALTWKSKLSFWGSAAALGIASAVHVASGHAAAGSTYWMAAQWIHIEAASVWIGGLAALLVSPKASGSVKRYSRVAGVSLVVVALMGTFRATRELGSLADLWTTPYGKGVATKIGLFALLALLGALNRFRNVARDDRAGLVRVGRLEIAVAAAVIAASAFVTSVAPARTVQEPERVEVAGTDLGDTTRVELVVTPGRAGVNRFLARVFDPDSGDVIDARSMKLRFSNTASGSSTLALRRLGSGEFAASGPNLVADGRWTLTAVVVMADDTVEVVLKFRTRCPTARTPGSPAIHDANLADGGTVQSYLDPARPGDNEIHFTFFDDAGEERSVPGVVSISATGEPGTVRAVVRQFSPGHFVGDAELPKGRWRFEVTATAPDGAPLTSCFEESVCEGPW